MPVKNETTIEVWFDVFQNCLKVGRITINRINYNFVNIEEVWLAKNDDIENAITHNYSKDRRGTQNDTTVCSIKKKSGEFLLKNNQINREEFRKRYKCMCGEHNVI